MRWTTHVCSLALAWLIALGATSGKAAPIVIDTFDVVFSTTGSLVDAGGYLGSRSISVSGGQLESDGSNLILTGATGTLWWPRVPGSDVDLLSGGNDRFELDVLSITGGFAFSHLFPDDGTPAGSVISFFDAPGTYQLRFADFLNTDFNSINQIRFSITSTGQITIGELRVVPEPGTAILLGVGLVGFVIAGPRRHRH